MNDISVDPPTNLKLRTTKWFSTGKESKKTILEDSDGRVSVLISSKQKQILFFSLFRLLPRRLLPSNKPNEILICSCVKYFLQIFLM